MRRIRSFARNVQRPIVIGLVLTVALLGMYGFLVLSGETCTGGGDCVSGWDRVAALTPNELGDAVAGVASALAFIWIIVTVIMQSLELRAQREELRLAIDQYQRMAAAQESQLRALELQSRILDDDRKERASQRSFDFITARLALLREQIAKQFPKDIRVRDAESGTDAIMVLGDPKTWPEDRFYWRFAEALAIIEPHVARIADQESSRILNAALSRLEQPIQEIRSELDRILPLEKARLEGMGLYAFLASHASVALLRIPSAKAGQHA